jgi:hypothetical protein
VARIVREPTWCSNQSNTHMNQRYAAEWLEYAILLLKSLSAMNTRKPCLVTAVSRHIGKV